MQVFRELSVDSWSSVAALNSCIGNIDEDEENSIMQAEMASQRGGGDTGEASHLCSTCCKITMLHQRRHQLLFYQWLYAKLDNLHLIRLQVSSAAASLQVSVEKPRLLGTLIVYTLQSLDCGNLRLR